MTEPFESRLQALAKDFEYPPTPSVKDRVMSRLHKPAIRSWRGRQLAWALTMFIVVLAGLMSVPTVRAAVSEFIQIGIVRIFPAPAESPSPIIETPVTDESAPTESILNPILETIGGETAFEEAQNKVGFSIPLPTYPSDLGHPDRVFVQDVDGWMVILIWLDPEQPDRVQLSLHMIEEGSWTINKYQPLTIQETTVNNRPAVWTVGEYPLVMRNSNIQFTRFINGHVLIWEKNKITYRLETDLEMDEAIRIAESLQAPPKP